MKDNFNIRRSLKELEINFFILCANILLFFLLRDHSPILFCSPFVPFFYICYLKDLDNDVEMGTHSLDEILAPKDKGQMSQHVPHFSSSSSFSSVTIVDSNGVSIITIKKAIGGCSQKECKWKN